MRNQKTILYILMTAAVLLAAPASMADEYEVTGELAADRFLPEDQLAGDEWKVEPTAVNDGMTNVYTLTSRFGSWEARGTTRVAMRIREVAALVELEQVSKSDVFLDAVKDTAMEPINMVGDIVVHPVQTVKGIPSGVGHWFRKTTFMVKETYHDVTEKKEKPAGEAPDEESNAEEVPDDATTAEESPNDDSTVTELGKKEALNFLKITGAERQIYAGLGVDPYSDNETLREAVSSVAKVSGLTSFGMKFVPIPRIPGAREIHNTMETVWKTDPWQLRLDNHNALLEAGISEEVAREFADHSFLTLTMQTLFIKALEDLEGVEGRSHLLASALDSASREEGELLIITTALFVRVHRQEEALVEFLPGSRLPVARTASGGLVAIVLADAAFWTEGVGSESREFFQIFADVDAPSRTLVVTGEVSEAFRAGVNEFDWEVRDRWSEAAAEETATEGESPPDPQ